MGVHIRPQDNRTQEQILATINVLLDKSPELKAFKSAIKNISPEYLGLTSDILELSARRELLPTAINISKVSPKTGKSLTKALLEELPRASKENPGALEFTREVINNTDSITSKYFLAELYKVIKNSKLNEQFRAAKDMVKYFAEQTLNGGYSMDYSKQKNFMHLIKGIVNSEAKPDKIRLLPKLCKIVDELPNEYELYLDKFTRSNTPAKQVAENLDVLKDVVKTAESQGKTIDIVDFVNNNVNVR